MKRGGTLKRSPLRRSSGLRTRPRPPAREEGQAEWKTPRWGFCAVCGAEGLIVRHHILTERRVRDAGRPDLAYDQRNALDVGAQGTCVCHGAHHAAIKDGRPFRIPLPLISLAAMEFASEVLGEDGALMYFVRFYAPEIPEGQGRWEP